jgi:hypothetical protein
VFGLCGVGLHRGDETFDLIDPFLLFSAGERLETHLLLERVSVCDGVGSHRASLTVVDEDVGCVTIATASSNG